MEKKPPKVKNPTAMVILHIVVICYAAYLFIMVLKSYLDGGEDAASLSTVIAGGAILLGGAGYVGYNSCRLYRQAKRDRDEEQKSQEKD